MQKLKFILRATLMLLPAFSIAQEKEFSYKNYVKPTLKVLGAAGCFWLAYKTGYSALLSGQMYLGAWNQYNNDVQHVNGQVGLLYSISCKQSQDSMDIANMILTPSAIACVSTSILGGILAKSAYDDVRKINAKNPKC